jgi:hypothetical protein
MNDEGNVFEQTYSFSSLSGVAFNRLSALFYLCLFLGILPAFASKPPWVGAEIESFAQTKIHPQVMYAAARGGGLFKSTDRGRSWEPKRILLRSGQPEVLVVPENHEHVIVWSHDFSKPDGGPFPAGYQESLDGGKTWEVKTISVDTAKRAHGDQVGDFVIDHIEHGGAWWAVVGNRLLRSLDAGGTWELNAENVRGELLLLHTPFATYRLSGNTLFRSNDRGSAWSVLHVFPVADGKNRSYATDLIRRSDGKLLLRIAGVWYQVEDNGSRVTTEDFVMADLPDNPGEMAASGTAPPYHGLRWQCRIRQAADVQDSLFAFCRWEDMITRLCLHRSDDGGNSWRRATKSLSDCHPDLPSFNPVAIWMDRADPNLIILSWVGGGVFRSEDGGKSWNNSDQGLRFRNPDDDWWFDPINENRLIRAVIERDKPTVERLLAEGEDVNQPGNYVSGVVEAAVSTLIHERPPRLHDSLYRYLRSRGAVPPLRRSDGSEGVMQLACRANLFEVVEDLVDLGYDWAYLSKGPPGSEPTTEFGECIGFDDSGARVVAGQPLVKWINRYIKVAKFPSADQVVFELIEKGRSDLAIKVLKAVSRRVGFDLQKTPASPKRAPVFSHLLEMKEYGLARKVFLSLPEVKNSDFDAAVGEDVALSLGEVCEPGVINWYEKKGVAVRYSFACLSDAHYLKSFRVKRLALMNSLGQVSPEEWEHLLNSPQTKWVENTPEYRRYVERNSGVVGIKYGLDHSGGLLISEVVPGYPAEEAGLRARDIIVGIDGATLTSENCGRLVATIRGHSNTKVLLRVRRDTEEWEVSLVRKRSP